MHKTLRLSMLVVAISMLSVIMILSISGCSCGSSESDTADNSNTSDDSGISGDSNSKDTGTIVFGVADAAAASIGISTAELSVDTVEVHTSGGDWRLVSSQEKAFELMELRRNGKVMLLVQADLPTGSYDMVRLYTTGMTVTDNNGTHECLFPSNYITLDAELRIESGETASVKLDFLLDQSVFETTEGYFFAPQIQVEMRNNCNVSVQAGNQLQISGGKVITDEQMGMQVDGAMATGSTIDIWTFLSINESGPLGIDDSE